MKKIKTCICLLIILLLTTACETKTTDKLNILTTVYPISYIVNELYADGVVTSIYPDGANIENYSLTDKQIDEYSKNNIFIYNGLSNEQNIAKNLINKNKKLKVIDVAYGLKYSSGMEELWLSPNYFLMLTTTVKDNLKNFTNSKYINDEIETKYNDLQETLSLMDAELREIAIEAKKINKNTIIASSDMFKYLESYGFNVISLTDEENLTTSNLNSLKNNFRNGTYTAILIKNTEEKSNLISTLEKDYGAKITTVNTMTTLNDNNKENNDNYLTIMEDYLNNLKSATLGE